ncbi:MAG: UDP-N-acetylmuramoyl-tripeptide--D-alanyl-D-alanine ligase [Endomicrobiia bacterium]
MNFVLDIPININKFLEKTSAKLAYPLRKKVYNIKKVITDTRKYDGKNGIFFALKGKNFDGHKFVKNIIKNIDFVVISDTNYLIPKYKNKFIIVEDTTKALDGLANLYRNSFPNLKVISVVGSNGKTTTKELIKHILSQKYKTLATVGNFNNLIGVAYTLLSLNRKIEFCVVEMGISLPGEMDILASTVNPDVVVFTNIGKEHLEFLDSLEKVFYEETRVLDYINPQKSMLIINRDDSYLKQINGKFNKKLYSLLDSNVDVYVEEVMFTEEYSKITLILKDRLAAKLKISLKTSLLGRHNVYNILASITTTFFNGIEELDLIIKAIEEFSAVSMRGEKFVVNSNIIIDESYNANPDSMKNAITTFFDIFKNRKKILILADMLELGKYSEQEHRRLLEVINLNEVEKIFLLGKEIEVLYEEIKKINKNKVKFYKEDKEKLLKDIEKIIKENNDYVLLFKSSHYVGLYEIVQRIKNFCLTETK